jgi:hypothetical protein
MRSVRRIGAAAQARLRECDLAASVTAPAMSPLMAASAIRSHIAQP